MKQAPHPKRARARGGRRGHNPRTHVFDSNGPNVRIRGHALQIFEKYQQLARDASAAGDRVGAENLLQHAEHYFRIATANAGANGTERRPRGNGYAARMPQGEPDRPPAGGDAGDEGAPPA